MCCIYSCPDINSLASYNAEILLTASCDYYSWREAPMRQMMTRRSRNVEINIGMNCDDFVLISAEVFLNTATDSTVYR